MSETVDETGGGRDAPTTRQRIERTVGIAVFGLLVVAPMIMAIATDRSDVVMPLQFGALAGAVSTLAGRRAAAITIAFGGVAVFTGGLVGTSVPAAVAVFGLLGVGVGWSAIDGLSKTVNVGAIAAGFAVSPTVDVGDAALDAALLVGGALWAAAALSLLVRRGTIHVHVPVATLSRRSVIAYAVGLGLAAAVVNGLVVGYEVEHGAWANLTLFLVALPSRHDLYRKALERTTGTVVGGAAALLLARALPWPDLWSVLSLVAIVPMLKEMTNRYWVYSAYLTIMVVFSSSDSTASLVEANRDRVVLTAVTAGAVVGVAWIANTVWTRTHPDHEPPALS